MDFTINRGWAFWLVLITAAIVYLPSICITGLKGEEGCRVLPEVELLKAGNRILPIAYLNAADKCI